jgi:hypothetical protein
VRELATIASNEIGGEVMSQHGQVFALRWGDQMRWAHRYREGGRGSRRVQRGGFESEQAANEALERALGHLRPVRRVYVLRHTFATFALRAGISTFDLSRYMGASLTMIDRHHGHLARDGREHAIRLLDAYTGDLSDVHAVDVSWTSPLHSIANTANDKRH